MNRITRAIIVFVVCAAMAIPVYQFASACQVDEFYHTNEGALAASTPETLITAIKLQEDGNKEKLAGPHEERESSAARGEHQGSGSGEIIRIQDAEDNAPG